MPAFQPTELTAWGDDIAVHSYDKSTCLHEHTEFCTCLRFDEWCWIQLTIRNLQWWMSSDITGLSMNRLDTCISSLVMTSSVWPPMWVGSVVCCSRSVTGWTWWCAGSLPRPDECWHLSKPWATARTRPYALKIIRNALIVVREHDTYFTTSVVQYSCCFLELLLSFWKHSSVFVERSRSFTYSRHDEWVFVTVVQNWWWSGTFIREPWCSK